MTVAEDDKVMDIEKPGSSKMPDVTSRPIIVGHKQTNIDPMMVDTKDVASSDTTTQHVVASGTKKISPLTKPDNIESTFNSQKQEPEGLFKKKELSKSDINKTLQKQEITDANGAIGSEDTYEALLKEKKYFLHIKNTAQQKKNASTLGLILGGILVLFLGVYATMDAGFIKAPFSLPFDFIKDTKQVIVTEPIPAPTLKIQPSPSTTPSPVATPTLTTPSISPSITPSITPKVTPSPSPINN